MSTLSNLVSLTNQATGKTRVVERVSVDLVVPNPTQVRKEFTNLDELAATIITEGQQTPIIVDPINSDGLYVIQKGERRWRACKLADVKYIDVIVSETPSSIADKVAGELIENIQRENLTPLEIATGLCVMAYEGGMKNIEIGNRIGKSEAFVSLHLSLMKLPEHILDLGKRSIVKSAEALNMLGKLETMDKDRASELIEKGKNEGALARDDIREALKKAKESLNPKVNEESDTVNIVVEEGEPVAKPAKKAKKKETEQTDGDNVQWRLIKSSNIVMTVEISHEGRKTQGQLLLDRVALDDDKVCVRVVNTDETESVLVVDADKVKLVSLVS